MINIYYYNFCLFILSLICPIFASILSQSNYFISIDEYTNLQSEANIERKLFITWPAHLTSEPARLIVEKIEESFYGDRIYLVSDILLSKASPSAEITVSFRYADRTLENYPLRFCLISRNGLVLGEILTRKNWSNYISMNTSHRSKCTFLSFKALERQYYHPFAAEN